jgi:putative hemolysin
MIALYVELFGIAVSAVVLFLLSLVEAALVAASPVTLRLNLERAEESSPPLLGLVIENKPHLFLPLHLGIQVALISITILFTHLSLIYWPRWGALYALGMALLSSLLLRHVLPKLLVLNDPEGKLVTLLRVLNPLIAVCRVLAAPLSRMFSFSRRLYREIEPSADTAEEDTAGEEMQAYLEIGENQGILEKEDTQLIQSVVEFGDTLVREVMTPRTAFAACSEDATMGELRDLMVTSRHSRIPIFREDIDHIIGVAYIRHLLARYAQGRESEPLTGLIHPAFFVPETKRVSALLKELQLRGDHMAIVIDEFGGVAGLVTIEDLIEEIVGEIRDEDQVKVSEIIEEGSRSYMLRGSTELYHLEQLSGKKFADCDASTVAGLIASYLGRIPAPGEEFDLEGLRFQIIDADRKRIRRLRIFLPATAAPDGPQTAAPNKRSASGTASSTIPKAEARKVGR